MDVLLTLPFVFFALLFLWLGGREVSKALTEIRTIARLKRSGVLQQGTILKIEMKRYPPTTYGKVVFQYKESKTTYLGKHLMSAASAKTLMKENRAVVLRYLPGQPRSARIERAITDSFETKRALIMGCASCTCFVLAMGATGTGFVLGWSIMAVEVFAILVFVVDGLLSMGVAFLALRFFLD
ncbi:MAG TPA: DUF3592 domain-containing protein [Ktedonobacteraceae bacterium]|nr:DUF3592 domain-containing protein [Ktedonobacteraceae bacterium]